MLSLQILSGLIKFIAMPKMKRLKSKTIAKNLNFLNYLRKLNLPKLLFQNIIFRITLIQFPYLWSKSTDDW